MCITKFEHIAIKEFLLRTKSWDDYQRVKHLMTIRASIRRKLLEVLWDGI